MSRYPSAQWRPIRDTSKRPLTKDLLCLHTMVGGMAGTWSYFDRLDVGVYSHFLVGGIWGSDAGRNLDGTVWQIADTEYRGAANLNGNWHVISVETGDNAARPIAPWTDKQCDAIVRIMADAHRLDGIPLELVPDSKVGRRGICYHRQGCDPYRVNGGELWSEAYGKDCPTDARIRQIPGLIARARAVVAGTVTPEEDLSIVDAETKKYLDVQFAKLGGGLATVIYGDSRTDLSTEPADTHPFNLQNQARRLDELEASVGELRTLIDTRLPALPPEPPA